MCGWIGGAGGWGQAPRWHEQGRACRDFTLAGWGAEGRPFRRDGHLRAGRRGGTAAAGRRADGECRHCRCRWWWCFNVFMCIIRGCVLVWFFGFVLVSADAGGWWMAGGWLQASWLVFLVSVRRSPRGGACSGAWVCGARSDVEIFVVYCWWCWYFCWCGSSCLCSCAGSGLCW